MEACLSFEANDNRRRNEKSASHSLGTGKGDAQEAKKAGTCCKENPDYAYEQPRKRTRIEFRLKVITPYQRVGTAKLALKKQKTKEMGPAS